MPPSHRSGRVVSGPKKPTLPQRVAKFDPASALLSSSAAKAAVCSAAKRFLWCSPLFVHVRSSCINKELTYAPDRAKPPQAGIRYGTKPWDRSAADNGSVDSERGGHGQADWAHEDDC